VKLALCALAAGLAGCAKGGGDGGPPAPPITAAWHDDFERADLGDDWFASGDGYRIVNGALEAQHAHNHPLWLRRALPRDVVVELDARSMSRDGDIKLEIFGDGHTYEEHPESGAAYIASGYVLVMGGWFNSLSAIARGNEHGADRKTRRVPRVEPGRTYHWKIVRAGGRLDWYVDDMATPFLSFDDPAPLAGPGHDRLGISDWDTDTWFDNLAIAPYAAPAPAP
jgi:hypothetical protein